MPVLKIGSLVGEHDTRLWRIIHHHLEEAYAKKDFSSLSLVGCDETSSKKGHNYVTVFADLKSREVVYATQGKNAETVKCFADELANHHASADQVKEVAIDMSKAFIKGGKDYLPPFNKCHVVKALNEVQDEVRRIEQRENPVLRKTRYIWLKNPTNLTAKQKQTLEDLPTKNLKTAKVYQMKLVFQDIYKTYTCLVLAEGAIKKWLSWAVRSRIAPVIEFDKTVKNHFAGIMRYFTSGLTSGSMEGINSRIQNTKRRARGFRNINNLIAMIYLENTNLEFDLPM